jgi:predicted GNAT family acetyltransferase
MSAPTPEVRHNDAKQRFEADVEGGVAHCDYQRRGDVLHVHHTEVPRAAEGRGVAGALVKALLAHAEREGLSIVPQCPYVRGYMQRHAETHKLLAQGTAL